MAGMPSNSIIAAVEDLIAAKDRAVAVEDYRLAAEIKDQIDALEGASSEFGGLILRRDKEVFLHPGDHRLPP
eukprot:CAMPEP_0172596740 /NCGR_PEP_ID=MMETSP1068-20121228/16584_1 /TAXON_ID=35684 /ORGANISM="Pseudopedinella elastica, Strain CCMP716" /LENGTH=71 /DNA_ID=CAMNT_0013395917 /DNA_START=48 /DNA_END=260 /DNA_ORIENTATION=-